MYYQTTELICKYSPHCDVDKLSMTYHVIDSAVKHLSALTQMEKTQIS